MQFSGVKDFVKGSPEAAAAAAVFGGRLRFMLRRSWTRSSEHSGLGLLLETWRTMRTHKEVPPGPNAAPDILESWRIMKVEATPKIARFPKSVWDITVQDTPYEAVCKGETRNYAKMWSEEDQ